MLGGRGFSSFNVERKTTQPVESCVCLSSIEVIKWTNKSIGSEKGLALAFSFPCRLTLVCLGVALVHERTAEQSEVTNSGTVH